MKRLLAKRKLKIRCISCNREIQKGEIYYKQRDIFKEDEKIYSYSHILCPKCNWNIKAHSERFKQYKLKCKHPTFAIKTNYHYIPGECVMEPDYDYCLLCGEIITQ